MSWRRTNVNPGADELFNLAPLGAIKSSALDEPQPAGPGVHLATQSTWHLAPIGPRLCIGVFIYNDGGRSHAELLSEMAELHRRQGEGVEVRAEESAPVSSPWPLDSERSEAAPVISNAELAARAREIAAGEPLRSPQRRAAAHLWVSLSTTSTLAAAARAARTFADRGTQDAALNLMNELEASSAAQSESRRADKRLAG